MCSRLTLNEITNRVVQAARNSLGDKLDRVILYGSYARGDYDNDSDIDIMVLANIPIEDRSKEYDCIWERTGDLNLEYDTVVSVSVADCKTFYQYAEDLPFYMNVMKDGVLLNG